VLLEGDHLLRGFCVGARQQSEVSEALAYTAANGRPALPASCWH